MDGTARRQIAIQNLVVALMDGDDLDPVIVSSCMYVENKTAERCVLLIKETVSVLVLFYVKQQSPSLLTCLNANFFIFLAGQIKESFGTMERSNKARVS